MKQKPKFGYYISSGQRGKMFTLRHWYWSEEVDRWTGEKRFYDYHIKTLSNDLEKAKAKATEILGHSDFEVRITEVGTITRRNLGPKDHTLLPYCLPPKFQGVSFMDEQWTPGQLLWVWKQINYKKSYKKTADLLLDHMKERGMIQWFKEWDEWVLTSFMEARCKAEEKAKASQFVGQVGDRIKDVEMTLDRWTFYETQYGTTWINILSDTDGNAFIYKGKSIGVEKGEKVTLLAGTIKEHSEYNGTKQTIINRPKFQYQP